MRKLTLAWIGIIVALQLWRRFFRDDRKKTEPPCALDSNNGKSAPPSSTPSPLHGEDNPGPPLNNEQHPENDDTSGESWSWFKNGAIVHAKLILMKNWKTELANWLQDSEKESHMA